MFQGLCDATSAVTNVENHVAHYAIDVVTDPAYLAYWGALDLNGAIHAGLGGFGRAGCDLANVLGAPLVPIQAAGLGIDTGGDWFKEHVLHVSGYVVGDEGNRKAYLLGSQLGPVAQQAGINWRHDFPGVRRNGSIDWWW